MNYFTMQVSPIIFLQFFGNYCYSSFASKRISKTNVLKGQKPIVQGNALGKMWHINISP